MAKAEGAEFSSTKPDYVQFHGEPNRDDFKWEKFVKIHICHIANTRYEMCKKSKYDICEENKYIVNHLQKN